MQHDFILLDRSGSMQDAGKWPESIKAINEYVKKLGEDNVDTGVTLAAFDKNTGTLDYRILRDRIVPRTWRPVAVDEVEPRGTTPLCDAIGRMVSQAEAGGYDRVAIIIMTDGLENASTELNVAQAKALLDRCRAKNWQVLFLGSDFKDNDLQAAAFGNASRFSTSHTHANTATVMRATAAKRAVYGATGQSISYSDLEKQSFNTDPGHTHGTGNT